MLLKPEMLNDKTFLKNSGILKKSFEYMTLQICNKYFIKKRFNNIKEFNEKNNIKLIKLALFPFFVATSNGHSKSLFNLFGNFEATELGAVSFEMINLIVAEEVVEFNSFRIKANKIEINDGLDDLITKFKAEAVIQNNQNIQNPIINFRDLQINSDKNEPKDLLSAIDSGVNTLSEQSLGAFFTFSETSLRNNFNKYKAFTNKINFPSPQNIIDYKDIESDKVRWPYYSNSE